MKPRTTKTSKSLKETTEVTEKQFQTFTHTTTYKMSRDPFELLGVTKEATVDEINAAFKRRLSETQKTYMDKPEKMVQESDQIYQAYRTVYMMKEGAKEDQMLPMQVTTPGTETNELMKMFLPIMQMTDLDVSNAKNANVQIQMQQQTQYRDGQLVNKRESRTEQFVNRDGKREIKIWKDGKLIKHTIDGKSVLWLNEIKWKN